MNVLKTLVTIPILGAMLASPATPQTADPPRRAARLGYMGGAVSLTPAGLQDATPAEVNRPFTTGDRFWSGPDGRGELQTENAAIRFDGRASFAIQELSNQATLIRLESGTLSVRLHALAPLEDFEIETPQFTFHFNRLGVYRVDAGEKGDTVVATARWGDAEVFRSDGAAIAVPRGKQARATAGGSPTIETANPLDQFEDWCVGRDRREDLSATARYVSRDVPGYADLDEHGAWRLVDQHGMAWFPSSMDPDWAPYRSGHFVSAGLWGMNWVDDASWGFGPLHYGRWLKVKGAWGWVPGAAGKSAKSGAPAQFAVRPYYAPALVAWTRFAAGVVRPDAVVGWFPLGPGEAWVPQFPASADYLARVNLSNTPIADPAALDNLNVARENYLYREAADMTAMGQEDLAAGHVVGRQYVQVPQTAYAQGTVSAQPGVAATREARLGPHGTAQGAPPEIANRSVVEHRVPSPQAAPAYVRQESTPQTRAGSSPQRAVGFKAGSASPVAPKPPSRQSATPAAAAPQHSGVQSVAPASAAPQRTGTQSPPSTLAARPGVPNNVSKGTVNGATAVANSAKGGTAKTGGAPHPPTPANGKQAAPKIQQPKTQQARPPQPKRPPPPPPRPPPPKPAPPPPRPKQP